MVLFLLLFVLGLALALIAGMTAAFSGKKHLAIASLVAGLIWCGIYLSLLSWRSAVSQDRLLEPGEEYRLHGFLLDPHFLFAVEDVKQTKALEGANAPRSSGVFYVVTIRYRSDARRAELRLPELDVVVIDETDHRFSPLHPVPLATTTQSTRPGESGRFDLVFDLPEESRNPRLALRSAEPLDRLLGKFVLDDEESIGHRRTTFRLSPAVLAR